MTTQQPPEPLIIDCARAQDLIFDALETGADETTPVSPELEAALERHVTDCDACLVYRHTLQNLSVSLSDALSDMEYVPVPSGLEDRIIATIAQSAASKNGSSGPAMFGGKVKRYAPLAAAVLVIAVAIPLVTQRIRPNGTPTDTPQVAQGVHPTSSVPSVTATPAPKIKTPVQTPESTRLASVPNAEQPAASILPQIAQPEATTAHRSSQTAHSHAATTAMAPMARNQSISGQQLAYNPDDQSDFPATANANTSQTNSSTGQASNTTIAVDPSSLASALPQSASQHFSNTYGSDSENDVYYDPVSNLVGF